MENQTKEGRPVQENSTFYSFVSGLGIGTFIWTKLLRFQYSLGFMLNLGIASGLGIVLGLGIVVLLDIWFMLASEFWSTLGIRIFLGSVKYIELSTGLYIIILKESRSAPKILPSDLDLAVPFTLGLVSAVVSWSGFWLRLALWLRLGLRLRLRLFFKLGLGLVLLVGLAFGLWMDIQLVLVRNFMFCCGWVLGILLRFGCKFLIKELSYKSQFGVGTEPKDEASEIDGHIALSESRLTQNANEHFEEAKEMIPQRKDKNLGIMTRNQPVKCSSTEGKMV